MPCRVMCLRFAHHYSQHYSCWWDSRGRSGLCPWAEDEPWSGMPAGFLAAKMGAPGHDLGTRALPAFCVCGGNTPAQALGME